MQQRKNPGGRCLTQARRARQAGKVEGATQLQGLLCCQIVVVMLPHRSWVTGGLNVLENTTAHRLSDVLKGVDEK